MRDHQAVQEESWMANQECVWQSVGEVPWVHHCQCQRSQPLGASQALGFPLCCWAPSSAVLALAPRDVLAWGEVPQLPSALRSSWPVQPLFQLMSNTGKFSNYSSIWGRNSILCSLHVKLHFGISVGSSGEGLCQELAGEKGSQCEPKDFRTGSVQAMNLLLFTCWNLPWHFWGAEGGRGPTAPVLVLTADVLHSLAWQKSTLPLHPRVQLLQFESWGCSEVSWRWAWPSNSGFLMSYKGLKEANKTSNW